MNENQQYDGWHVLLETLDEFEAEMVRDSLDDAGIPAVMLNKKDHAYAVNLGGAGHSYVLVPPEHAEEAQAFMTTPLTDAELEQAASEAEPLEQMDESNEEEA